MAPGAAVRVAVPAQEDASNPDPEALWSSTRAGARAGRGFHYQDVVGAWLCGRVLTGELTVDRVVPEGYEDLSCEGQSAWQVQVKSRQERVGSFTTGEVAGHVLDLAERHAHHEKAGLSGRPVLVLERGMAGWAPSEWGVALINVSGHDELLTAIRQIGARRDMDAADVEAVARLVSVVVLPWNAAADQTRAAIATRHPLPPLAADPIVLALRNEVAGCVDTNAEQGWSRRASLDRTQIERVVSDAVALVDLESLEEALSAGLCEPVDFDTPLELSGFYEGVDVQPGHVVAGLPAPRPAVTGRVVAALDGGGSVLVTGPSGVGKSTVMWAAAYCARHVLWYRVRRLQDGDVDALVRLAKSARPTTRTPVGFVVDAVGVGPTQAWDLLQRELAAIPGTVLLGSARTEDLLPLRTLPGATLVGVRLDEEVAAQIHEGLLRSGAITAPHWREAFDGSDGLTLEFTHLLTRGRRLSDVLTEQVNRRVADGRDLELQVMALVATAHRWSAYLSLESVRDHLGADSVDLRVALARLSDEHLVHVHGTQLTGLHQLRSRALSVAVHNTPPPTLGETAVAVLQLLDDKQLQPFVVGVLTEHPDFDDIVLTQLVREVRRRSTPAALTGALQALRLVDFQRHAATWVRVLERHHVEPAYRPITMQLAVLGSEPLAEMRPEILGALQEISLLTGGSPLREELLTEMGPSRVMDMVAACADIVQATVLLAVMAGTNLPLAEQVGVEPPRSSLEVLLGDASAPELADLLAVAFQASEPLAHALFELAGGQEGVFARMLQYSPWLVEVAVVDRGGVPVGFARLLHVSDAAEPDIDAHVRDVARTLLRCLPMCASVDVQATLAGNVPIRVGDHTIGVSQLQRQYDHSPTAIAWNRVRTQAAVLAAGTGNATSRAAIARQLVVDVHQYLRELTQAWCVSRGRSQEARRLEAQRTALRSRADALTLLVDRPDLDSIAAADAGTALDNDELHTVLQGIVDNLTQRLHDTDANWASLAAFTGDTLRGSVAAVRAEERWDLIGEQPPEELDQIEVLLGDLHDTLAELAWGELTPALVVGAARAGSYPTALSRVAALAREMATSRFASVINELTAAARATGVQTRVWARPLTVPDAVDWPPTQVAVGVDVTSLAQWEPALETVTELLDYDPASQGRRAPVLVVPLIGGQPVRPLARSVQTNLWPGQDLYDTWADDLDPIFPTPLTDAVVDAHQALQGLSGLAALASRRDNIATLQPYADSESARFERALAGIVELNTSSDPVLDAVIEFFVELGQRVQMEINDRAQQHDTLAAGIAEGFVHSQSDDMNQMNGVILISLHWDIDPTAAAVLLSDDA
jgi:hypothetical protein